MKVVGEILAGGKSERRREAAGRAGRAWTVQGTMNCSRFLADVFHDVDFAALGPANRTEIVAQGPKARPQPLPCGYFYAGLEPAINLAESSLGLQTRRGVVAGYAIRGRVRLLLCGNDQVAGLDLRVLRAIRVVLKFVVAPAAAPGVVSPFRGVRQGAIRAAEFVAPNQGEARWDRMPAGGAGAAERYRSPEEEP